MNNRSLQVHQSFDPRVLAGLSLDVEHNTAMLDFGVEAHDHPQSPRRPGKKALELTTMLAAVTLPRQEKT
jgi:hypothetical protein